MSNHRGYIVAHFLTDIFLETADAFYARRRGDHIVSIQNRSRTSVVAMKSYAAAEKSKDQLSRDFWGCSIFDFCNNICHKRTHAPQQLKASFNAVQYVR